MFLRRQLFFVALVAVSAANAECVPLASLRSEGVVGRNVSLRYEGTCAHLACCSAHAVVVPAETVGAFRCDASKACGRNGGWFAPGFTCNPLEPGRYRQPGDPPYLECRDNERWLSLPGLTHAQCGERYLVCHRGVRVTAVARDRSASNDSGNTHYEGSLGLVLALGASPDERETFVSVYALHERDRIASDPHCVGSGN